MGVRSHLEILYAEHQLHIFLHHAHIIEAIDPLIIIRAEAFAELRHSLFRVLRDLRCDRGSRSGGRSWGGRFRYRSGSFGTTKPFIEDSSELGSGLGEELVVNGSTAGLRDHKIVVLIQIPQDVELVFHPFSLDRLKPDLARDFFAVDLFQYVFGF